MAIVAVPVLVLLDERFVPVPLLLTNVLLTGLAYVRDRNAVDRQAVLWLVSGRVPGTTLGLLLLRVVAPRGLQITIAASILLAALHQLATRLDVKRIGQRSVARPSCRLVYAGLASGVSATATAVGGVPVAMAYQPANSARVRATLSAFFLIGSAMSLIALILAGEFGTQELRLSAMLMPGTFAGYLASRYTIRAIHGACVPYIAATVGASAAIAILLRALL